MTGFAGLPFASLGTPENGSYVYCSDCTFDATTGVCNTGGAGSAGRVAKRLFSTWCCAEGKGFSTCGSAILDADVPDTITASNYLPLAGGTMTGNLALAASGVAMSGGGLVDCDTEAQVLGWDSATQRFVCTTDAGAGGGMTSFTLAGDAGAGQTITDGNTATIAGGADITCTGAATDTVTCDLDNTLTGRSGGRTFNGGTAASELLSLQSTSNATKGEVRVGAETLNLQGSSGAATAPALGLYEAAANGSDYVGLRAPASVASPWVLTLPNTGGTNLYFLQTNGSGVTTWAEPTLGTHTAGNFVASVATSAPLTGGAAGSEGATLTLACTNASAGVTGCLTGTDWSTFNSKLSAEVDGSTTNELQNIFQTFDASSGTDPVADTTTDTLIVTGTAPITVTGDATADSLVIAIGDVALTTNTSGNYVATVTGGAGIASTGATSGEGIAHTLSTASGETDFLASGALTCTTAQQGRMQVHTTPLQYCDNAATPTLRYAAYGDSAGVATSTAALALTSDPTDCSGNNFALGIGTNGNAACAQPAFTNINGTATDAQVPNQLTFQNASGILIQDTDASHTLGFVGGSNLSANRTLTLTTGDANRILTLGGDTTLNGGTHSGTNTGDQTITLTGDVTGTGTGSFAATIANDAVTYAKMQNVSAISKLLGRGDTGAPADVQEITLGTNLAMSGTTLNASGGGGTECASSPCSLNAGTTVASSPAVNDNDTSVATTAFVQAESVATGDVTGTIGGGLTIANDAVTFAKMQNVSAVSKLLGRGDTGAPADVQEITLGTNLSMSGTTLNASGGGGGDAVSVNGSAATDANFLAGDGIAIALDTAPAPDTITVKRTSIMSAGAVCDGSTSDTTAVQALEDALTAAGGGVIVVPAGKVCALGAQITPKTKVSIQCEPGAGFKAVGSITTAIFKSTSAVDDWTVTGCTLDLNSKAGINAYFIDDGSRWSFTRNTVSNVGTGASAAYDLVRLDCTAGACTIEQNTLTGSNTAATTDTAIASRGAVATTIDRNTVLNPGAVGIYVSSPESAVSKNTVKGLSTANVRGIHLDANYGSVLGNFVQGDSGTGTGIWVGNDAGSGSLSVISANRVVSSAVDQFGTAFVADGGVVGTTFSNNTAYRMKTYSFSVKLLAVTDGVSLADNKSILNDTAWFSLTFAPAHVYANSWLGQGFTVVGNYFFGGWRGITTPASNISTIQNTNIGNNRFYRVAGAAVSPSLRAGGLHFMSNYVSSSGRALYAPALSCDSSCSAPRALCEQDSDCTGCCAGGAGCGGVTVAKCIPEPILWSGTTHSIVSGNLLWMDVAKLQCTGAVTYTGAACQVAQCASGGTCTGTTQAVCVGGADAAKPCCADGTGDGGGTCSMRTLTPAIRITEDAAATGYTDLTIQGNTIGNVTDNNVGVDMHNSGALGNITAPNGVISGNTFGANSTTNTYGFRFPSAVTSMALTVHGNATTGVVNDYVNTRGTYGDVSMPTQTIATNANQSNSTTSWANVTGLALSMEPVRTYFFRCDFQYYAAATTTAIDLAMTGPSSPTSFTYLVEQHMTTGATGTDAVFTKNANGNDVSGMPATSCSNSSTTPCFARVNGNLVTGANAGTLQARYKSEVGGSAVTILRGANCLVFPVPESG